MTLKDVRLKSIDEKSGLRIPSRSLELIFSKENILTPSRAAISSEYNFKDKASIKHQHGQAISYYLRKFNFTNLGNYLTKNDIAAEVYKEVENFSERMKYSSFHFTILQPTASPIIIKEPKKTIDSGIELLLGNPKQRDNFLELTIEMQTTIGSDVVTLPYLRLPWSSYKELLRRFVKQVRKDNNEPLIVFDLDYGHSAEQFSEALKFLVNDCEIRLIAMPHRSYKYKQVSYLALSKYVKKDVAFISLDVERADGNYDNISTMHYLPFLANDIFGVRVDRYIPPPAETVKGGSAAKKDDREQTKESVKFFNPSNLRIEPALNRAIDDPKRILKEIGESDNENLLFLLNNYDGIQPDSQEIKRFAALSRVHELIASGHEMAKFQKWIDRQESKEYIKSHKSLEASVKPLSKKSEDDESIEHFMESA